MTVMMRRLKLLLSHEKVQMEQEERKELRANCAAEYTTKIIILLLIGISALIQLCLQFQLHTGAINQQIMHFKCKKILIRSNQDYLKIWLNCYVCNFINQ